ncbi:oligosaccharide flippase family protein [Candidatus Woesearchaeota archaeon]|nr:oligosaccharide flippase family protein [Candidatus Woesearchaeota archaeon]
MEYKRVLKDGMHFSLGKVGTILISLINTIILARLLTTTQMGQYSLFLMIVNLAVVITFTWSDNAIIRHGREEYTTSKEINKSFWARNVIIGPATALITTAIIIFRKDIAQYIGMKEEIIIFILILFIIQGIFNYINSIFQGTNQMQKSAYLLLFQKAIYLVTILALMTGFFQIDNLYAAIIFLNLSFIIVTAIQLIQFRYHQILPAKYSKQHLKKIWSYSWPHIIGFPGIYVINYIDLFVIRQFMDLEAVGTYNIAYLGFTNICTSIMLINTVMFPLLVEYKTKKNYEAIRKYLSHIPKYTFIWIILTIIGLFLSPHVIPALFSTQYVSSIPSFNILLIASIVYFIYVCLIPLVNTFDLIIYSQTFNVIKAGINIGLDFILIPKMGIIGAAYGTLVSYAVGTMLIILLLIYKRKLFLHTKEQ